jgi:hypothetical protein
MISSRIDSTPMPDAVNFRRQGGLRAALIGVVNYFCKSLPP